jgi:hypothetical protein
MRHNKHDKKKTTVILYKGGILKEILLHRIESFKMQTV